MRVRNSARRPRPTSNMPVWSTALSSSSVRQKHRGADDDLGQNDPRRDARDPAARRTNRRRAVSLLSFAWLVRRPRSCRPSTRQQRGQRRKLLRPAPADMMRQWFTADALCPAAPSRTPNVIGAAHRLKACSETAEGLLVDSWDGDEPRLSWSSHFFASRTRSRPRKRADSPRACGEAAASRYCVGTSNGLSCSQSATVRNHEVNQCAHS